MRPSNTYSGGTTVSTGTLLAKSSTATGTGNVTVASGALLGGMGTMGSINSAPNITVTGDLMAGDTHNVNTIGGGAASMLTLASKLTGGGGTGVITLSGMLQFDIFNRVAGANPTGNNDLLILFSDTNVVLGVSSSLVVKDPNLLASSYASGDIWQLIDWTNALGHTGSFGSIVLPTLNSGLTWNTSNIYSAGTIDVTSAVPEPSRAVLMLFGAAGLLLRHRRKMA